MSDCPWLTLIGIGEDGLEGLSKKARTRLEAAVQIVGAARQLAMVPHREGVVYIEWKGGYDGVLHQLRNHPDRPTVILASGDPFCFGIGRLVSQRFDAASLEVIPSVSSVTLAFAIMRWSSQDTRVLSICGRDLDTVRPHLQPGAQLLILSADHASPARICQLLRESGLGRSDVMVLENLGGPRQKVRCLDAEKPVPEDIASLNIVAVRIEADVHARVIPLSPGLNDAMFANDGQLTRCEIRAATLSALAPLQGETLWDLGAGSGSVAIEWMLRHPANQAVAFERDAARVARIFRNARQLGVPALQVLQASLPEYDVSTFAPPDAIFIGGGVSAPGMLSWARGHLRSGGRLVCNAVTQEGEVAVFEAYQMWGGDLRQLSISRLERLGRYHGFRPAMSVTQYVLRIS